MENRVIPLPPPPPPPHTCSIPITHSEISCERRDEFFQRQGLDQSKARGRARFSSGNEQINAFEWSADSSRVSLQVSDLGLADLQFPPPLA